MSWWEKTNHDSAVCATSAILPPPSCALVLRHVESSPGAGVQSLEDELLVHPSPSPHTELLPSVQVPAPSRFIHALPLTQAQSLSFLSPALCSWTKANISWSLSNVYSSSYWFTTTQMYMTYSHTLLTMIRRSK
jgi:hypothetical protein